MNETAATKPNDIIVHIVDDDRAMHELVAAILSSVGIESRSWESPVAFLEATRHEPVDAVVVDVRLSGMSGLEVVRRLRAREQRPPVVLISGVDELPVVIEAMKLGAHDFLRKPFSNQALVDAVQAALRQSRAESVRNEYRRLAGRLVESLSPREHEVFLAVVDGNANKVVASNLGISEKTVEEHRAHVMLKLRASSVADLVKVAVVAGVIDPLAAMISLARPAEPADAHDRAGRRGGLPPHARDRKAEG